MTTTSRMPSSVRDAVDTKRIRPDDDLDCTEKCPSMLRGKCLICGFPKTTVEHAADNEYSMVSYCEPVFNEIQRQYGEHKARRDTDSPGMREVTEYTAVHHRLGNDFDQKVTSLLGAGWKLRDKLLVRDDYGTQAFLRTHEVPNTFEEKEYCDHAFSARGNDYVCADCDCVGVRLSEEQQAQCKGLPFLSVTEYADLFLP